MLRLCGKLKIFKYQLSGLYTIMLVLLLVNTYLLYRYFGSAEGSQFVEAGSVENVKRTWVDYGIPRDWTQPTQGQVCVCVCVCVHVRVCVCVCVTVAKFSPCDNPYQTPLSLSVHQGEEFLYHSTEVKNIWMPMGEIFAN